jgi:hypothetical protein
MNRKGSAGLVLYRAQRADMVYVVVCRHNQFNRQTEVAHCPQDTLGVCPGVDDNSLFGFLGAYNEAV